MQDLVYYNEEGVRRTITGSAILHLKFRKVDVVDATVTAEDMDFSGLV